MEGTELVELETAVNSLPGVLGCVIVSTPSGDPAEIQAFTRLGSDRAGIERGIVAEVERRGAGHSLREVFVFELEAEEQVGDRGSLQRAAELAEQEEKAEAVSPGERRAELRPALVNVSFASAGSSSVAHVDLTDEGHHIVGTASGHKTAHGLGVLAQAALDAVARIAPGGGLRLVGASLVTTFEREAVLVVVEAEGSTELIGAALVRSGVVAEAAVRATLDAVNRRLSR